MKNLLRQHWGALFLTVVALTFMAVQLFFSTHRKKALTEIFFADRLTEAHRVLIDDYNRMHQRDVRIVPIDFPNADFTTNERKEVLARSLRGEGDDIDVFAVDPIWVQRFARWSEPLDQYFDKSELADITEETLEPCYKDGKLVAIPFDQVRGVLLYREDLLSAMPGGSKIVDNVNKGITWEEFVQYGMKTRSPNHFYVFPAAEYEGLLCVFTEILLGRERDYFNIHGFNFETLQAKDALQFLVDLVHKSGISPEEVTAMTEVSSYEYFMQHNGIFLRGWTSYEKDFPMSADQKRVLRMAPLPHFRDGFPASTIGGWNLMISKFSPKKTEAISFVKFLLRRESQEVLFTKGGYFPVIRSLLEDRGDGKEHPELVEMNRMLDGGVLRPSHEKYTKYSEILAHYVSQAIRGAIPVDEALRQATRSIESEKITFADGEDSKKVPVQ